jgi:uncharacterized protein
VSLGPLTKYFLLTFLLSWACFISAVILSHKIPGSLIPQLILGLLGTVTPSLVALRLTAQEEIPGQVQNLLTRVLKWNVNIKWYLFAASFILVVKICVAFLYKIITGTWPHFGEEAWYVMLTALLFSTWIQAGEEIGWRGFALPRMSVKIGLPKATLLLGVIWAFWHLPLFFLKGATTYGQSFPLYFIQVTMLSVAVGWLYWRTKGSLLLTMLMHAAVNNTKDIVPSAVPNATNPFALSDSLVAWLTVLLLVIFAAYCLLQMKGVKQLD